MSLEPQLASLLSQQFTVQNQPDNADPDEWQGTSWVSSGIALGRIEQFVDPPSEPVGDAPSGRNSGVGAWRCYMQPTATDTDSAVVTTLTILKRTSRLVGPSPETRVFSVQGVAEQYDEDGLHHLELLLSEVT